MKGYIEIQNGIYYVYTTSKKKIPVTRNIFPKFIEEYGDRETLLAVSWFIVNGTFKKNYNNECKQEIKFAIGDQGW